MKPTFIPQLSASIAYCNVELEIASIHVYDSKTGEFLGAAAFTGIETSTNDEIESSANVRACRLDNGMTFSATCAASYSNADEYNIGQIEMAAFGHLQDYLN